MIIYLFKMMACTGLVVFSLNSHAHGDKHVQSTKEELTFEQQSWGIAAPHRAGHRVVQIDMSDNMTFSPKLIKVKLGERIRFMLHNKGQVLHEFVMGTAEDLATHAELMKRFPDMAHDEPHMAHVPAGKTEQIDWLFNRAGSFDFACLMPGHFEAGMVGRIVVSK